MKIHFHSCLRSGIAGTVAALLASSSLAAEKVLTIGSAAFPDSLSTTIASFAALNLDLQTLDTLVLRDDVSHLLPGLAEKWETRDDLTWRFYLRKGVKFHDGAPFTAKDVKNTLDYALDPKSVYGNRSRIDQIKEVRIIDDYTVDLVTKEPFPTLANGLSDIPIEPKHYQDKVGRDAMAKHPIGTGPFKFVKWVPGDRYELDANKEYWQGAPKIDRVVLRQIPEGATRVASLLAGETQIIEEVPVDLIPKIASTRGVEIADVESTVALVLTYDTSKPPFNNVKVRQALNYAVDKDTILKQMLQGRGTVLQGQVVTSNTFGFNPNIKAYPYDPAKAKQLLAEAGYPRGFETSITTRSGKYLSDVEISNAVAGMLMNVGVRTSVNVVEGGVYTKMVTAHDMGPMHIVGWYSLGDADFGAVWFTQGSKRAYWKSDEYEKLFVEARTTVDEKKREKAYHRMMEIVNEEAPSIFLFGLPSIYAKSSKLTGWGAPADKVLRLYKADLTN